VIVMVMVREGRVAQGQIVIPNSVDLPDGTAVRVSIEVMESPLAPAGSGDAIDYATLPSFGMWADRPDMTDSVAWANQQRDAWRHRAEPAG
jgi:hypothetical protein